MTVKMALAKGAKKFIRLTPKLKKAEATERAEKSVKNVVVEGLKSMLRRNKVEIVVDEAKLLYHPFWVVSAQSSFHYTRMDQYAFEVAPEVRLFKIGSKKFEASEGQCTVSGESTCYEQYDEFVVQDGLQKKGRDFSKYASEDYKEIKSLKSVKDGKVADLVVRASYVLNTIYPKIIRPINADKVLESKVEVDRLELWLVPTYVFTLSVDGVQKRVSVDAVTGETRKDSYIKTLTKEYLANEAVFDVSTEVVAAFIPGGGVGVVLARKAFEKRQKDKRAKKREKFSSDYKKRKK